MNTIELCLSIDEGKHDLIIAELNELGFEGYVQDENTLKAYVPESSWKSESKERVKQILSHLSGQDGWDESVIPEQDWNEPWEKSIQPIRVGQFLVRPSWTHVNTEEDLTEIIIDPKMSFGTGHHETTRLILHELPRYIKENSHVLDAGSGTGVLAIAAAKLGASAVIGFDIDSWAIENGEENIERNNVASQIIFRKGSFDVVQETGFDVILANINLNVLLQYNSFFCERLSPNGVVLLSGVLVKDAEKIVSSFHKEGLFVKSSSSEGEWWCAVLEKKEQYI